MVAIVYIAQAQAWVFAAICSLLYLWLFRRELSSLAMLAKHLYHRAAAAYWGYRLRRLIAFAERELRKQRKQRI